jgi:hypothetical protein
MYPTGVPARSRILGEDMDAAFAPQAQQCGVPDGLRWLYLGPAPPRPKRPAPDDTLFFVPGVGACALQQRQDRASSSSRNAGAYVRDRLQPQAQKRRRVSIQSVAAVPQ